MARPEEAHFDMTFWNGLEWRKMLLSRLECFGIEEVDYGLPLNAWNENDT
jgi:hypothetical protein